jgi:SAM-dependent methyltransferase
MSEAELWDTIYASRGEDPSRDPNPQLVAEAADLTPGRALEIGCAEGADAAWLAARGWGVTAVDISGVALNRARNATPEFAGRIEWLCADLLQWVPPVAAYDLVSSHFVHFLPPDRDVAIGRLAAAVRQHGTLLIVAHDPSDLQTTVKRWPVPDAYATAQQLTAMLVPDDWDVVVAEARPREVTDQDGNPVTVHDVILKARRRPDCSTVYSRR